MNDLGERDIRKDELDKSRGDSRKFPVQLVKSMESGVGMGCGFSISRVINVLSRSRGEIVSWKVAGYFRKLSMKRK